MCRPQEIRSAMVAHKIHGAERRPRGMAESGVLRKTKYKTSGAEPKPRGMAESGVLRTPCERPTGLSASPAVWQSLVS